MQWLDSTSVKGSRQSDVRFPRTRAAFVVANVYCNHSRIYTTCKLSWAQNAPPRRTVAKLYTINYALHHKISSAPLSPFVRPPHVTQVLFSGAPIVWFKPARKSDLVEPPSYACPVYKTSDRRGILSTTGHSTNFICFILLASHLDSSHWVQRGVAMLTSLDD